MNIALTTCDLAQALGWPGVIKQSGLFWDRKKKRKNEKYCISFTINTFSQEYNKRMDSDFEYWLSPNCNYKVVERVNI